MYEQSLLLHRIKGEMIMRTQGMGVVFLVVVALSSILPAGSLNVITYDGIAEIYTTVKSIIYLR